MNMTQEARVMLDEWMEKHTPAWQAEGADVVEVRQDLEAHLRSDLSQHGESIGVDAVRAALVKMGMPSTANVVPVSKTDKPPKRGWTVRFFIWISTHWFWLVLWPVLVVAFELLTGFCEGMFYSPVPSWAHATLLFGACAAGAYHYKASREKGVRSFWHGLCRYAALPVVTYWGIVCLPVLVIGTIGYGMGVFFTMGIGLLAFPLYLLCALTAAAPILLGVGLLRRKGGDFSRASKWGGVCLGILFMLVVEGPSYVTRYGVAVESPKLIRALGSERVLLNMCYEGRGGRGSQLDAPGFLITLLSGNFNMGWSQGNENVEACRGLYYRVTGKAFNSVPAPAAFYNRRSTTAEVEFDENLGGDGVHARVADLDLSSSRMDGHIDAASGLGYWEWTMEFSNTGVVAKEARMQILLPPQGVVSRLTLWVNGEPREAAFSSTAKVTEAYKAIAVVQRRDPVLVRWVGPDRVFVQCFPVPAGGRMKIRLGITAELDGDGRMFLPRIIEHNYGIPEKLDTALWVQGDVDLEMKGVEAHGVSGRWRETHGKLSATALASRHAYVSALDHQQVPVVWTEDRFADGDENILVRELVKLPEAEQAKKKIVVVIDGSAGLADWRGAIAKSVRSLVDDGHSLHLLVATDDGVLEDINTGDLADFSFVGGQDNLAALVRGYEVASETQSDLLVWLHGSQPVDFGSAEALSQMLERGFHKPKIATVDITSGPNKALEVLGKAVRIDFHARPDSSDELASELARIIKMSQGHLSRFEWKYITRDALPENAHKVWDHLARWHTWQDVQYERRGEDVVRRASLYQLVTPVSGAVVLETREQYKAFGLDPVDASTVPKIPSVPEPSSSLLVMLGLTMALLRRSRESS